MCKLLFAIGLSTLLLFAEGALGQKQPDEALAEKLKPLLREHAGDVSLSIRNIETGAYFEYRADEVMPTASLIKLPIMITAYRMMDAGELSPSQAVSLSEDDKVPGSGILTEHFSSGVELPLQDCIRLMIRYSDNTATNLVVDQIGLAKTTETMKSLGFSEMQLNSKVYRGSTSVAPERSKKFGLGSTTAREMVELLCQLEAGKLATEESNAKMLEHLLACEDETKIAAGIPGNMEFAHKTGAVANCRTDAGILTTPTGKVAVCFLTNRNEDQSWGNRNAAQRLAASVGEIIVERFGQAPAESGLREGSFGKLVEALQRTLNARLDPSPGLAVDGDYGPATRSAVERFQRENDLKIDGKVSDAVWKKLGKILDQERPVADPEVVNAEKLSKEPMPALDASPIVTAKAWTIMDADTGEQLAGFNADTPLDPASTTKIMTAYLVLRFAKDHPKALDEIVEYSATADQTRGSTSAIREGERLSVREVLYGLLLPSGNDASVALAEHFGERIAASLGVTMGDVGSEDADGEGTAKRRYQAFVASMNETASRLGLKNAHYENTHGLTAAKHKITANELAILGREAMKLPHFAEIASTRQRGATVVGPGGYKRNVIWKNTNRLLGIEGYAGIKTGTTTAAGACLVGLGRRGDAGRIVVVLGSSSSAARYSDIRNLFRWSWATHDAESSKH